jgi:transcriptional regulator with XRE-family HTH domain
MEANLSSRNFADLAVDLAGQIRRWRIHRTLTQAELESRAGLAHNAISRIEKGAVTPRLNTLEKIAHALEVNIEELQFRVPKEVRDPSPDFVVATSLLDRLEGLPPVKRQKVVAAFIELLDQMEPSND